MADDVVQVIGSTAEVLYLITPGPKGSAANMPRASVRVQRVGGGPMIVELLTDLDIESGDFTLDNNGTGDTTVVPPAGVTQSTLGPRVTVLSAAFGVGVAEDLGDRARVRTYNVTGFGAPPLTNYDFILDFF